MVERLFKQEARRHALKVFLFVPFFLLLFTFYFLMPVCALTLDTSVDDEIRRNYNPSKLEEDVGLPALPKIIQEEKTPIKPGATVKKAPTQKAQAQKPIETPALNSVAMPPISTTTISKSASKNYAVLKKGTKIRLKLIGNVSDATKKGSQLSFVSEYPVTTTCFTIPMGTTFKGKLIDAHKPQFGGNGGLIKLNITSVTLDNGTQPINAYVTKANNKHIFFNNIKGKRKYLKSMYSSTKPGRHFFNKMMGLTVRLAGDGSSIVITPFSLASGVIAVGGNALASPVLALFYKGSSISSNSGSEFDVKLIQDVFVYY